MADTSLRNVILDKVDTDKIVERIKVLLDCGTEQYFAPLTDKTANRKVDKEIIADIHILTAELTARWLLSGF
jgi:uncharacterized protein YdiU (UPF0061 family)